MGTTAGMHYYRHDLALIHDRGHGQHADRCAGGVLAIDVLDLAFGQIDPGRESAGRVAPDWAVIAQYSRPARDTFVRDITTFVPDGSGAWRRGGERHENVLVDTSGIPALLRDHGVDAVVGPEFGEAELPPGLVAVTGKKDTSPG